MTSVQGAIEMGLQKKRFMNETFYNYKDLRQEAAKGLPIELGSVEKATTGKGPNGHTHEFTPGERRTGPPINEPDGRDRHTHAITPGKAETEPSDVDNHVHTI